MSDAFYVGGAGLRSQQKALDVIANNITNLNTYGYKRSEVQFSAVMAGRAGPSGAAAPATSAAAGAREDTSGVTTAVRVDLDAQGEIERTGGPMDLAIEGRGFLELMGARGETLLWRGGQLAIGDDGMLSTGGGLPLRALISVPIDATDITIEADGTISVLRPDGAGSEAVEEIGQLRLVRVEDSTGMERLDGGLYKAGREARLFDASAGEDGAGLFVQGGLERSNVDMNAEMVQLMITQRAFAANAQVVQAADQVMSIANSLRR